MDPSRSFRLEGRPLLTSTPQQSTDVIWGPVRFEFPAPQLCTTAVSEEEEEEEEEGGTTKCPDQIHSLKQVTSKE